MIHSSITQATCRNGTAHARVVAKLLVKFRDGVSKSSFYIKCMKCVTTQFRPKKYSTGFSQWTKKSKKSKLKWLNHCLLWICLAFCMFLSSVGVSVTTRLHKKITCVLLKMRPKSSGLSFPSMLVGSSPSPPYINCTISPTELRTVRSYWVARSSRDCDNNVAEHENVTTYSCIFPDVIITFFFISVCIFREK